MLCWQKKVIERRHILMPERHHYPRHLAAAGLHIFFMRLGYYRAYRKAPFHRADAYNDAMRRREAGAPPNAFSTDDDYRRCFLR